MMENGRSPASPVLRCDRIVAHFDVDCFYAQTEMLRNPLLMQQPVGVTQKFLVVTCNYAARQLGVGKMVTIEEAQRRCPNIVLINGEDLTPYRAASKTIMDVIRRFGIFERSGLDECFLDITSEVQKRATSGVIPTCFNGFVLDANLKSETVDGFLGQERSNSNYANLSDPRTWPVPGSNFEQESASLCCSELEIEKTTDVLYDARGLLSIGSHYVAEIRTSLEKETGFQCSCGISYNKMLAKLACSVNKPNKQTCLLKSALAEFLWPLPVRKIPGVGERTECILKEIGVKTVAELQSCCLQKLVNMFGSKIGTFLFEACQGVDERPVQDKGPLKSVSVEDSFPPCTSLKGLESVLSALAADLIARLDDDYLETGRRPYLFTVKWKQKNSWNFASASCPMPSELLSTKCPVERRKNILVQTGMNLLSRNLGGRSFSVVVINIGATNFKDSRNRSLAASKDIRSLLQNYSRCHEANETPGKRKAIFSGREEITNVEAHYEFLFHPIQETDVNAIETPSVDYACNTTNAQRSLDDKTYLISRTIEYSRAGHDLNNVPVSCVCQSSTDCGASEVINEHEETRLEKPLLPSGVEKTHVQLEILHDSNSSQLEISCALLDSVSEMPSADDLQCIREEACYADVYKETGVSTNVMNNKLNERFQCKKCEIEIDGRAHAIQEHEDYHYALELQTRETNSDSLSLFYGRNTSTNNNGKRLSSKKHKKPHIATLDSYFKR